jgi:fructokinase
VPTGVVRVTVDARGNAEYEVVEPAAWDGIVATDALLTRSAEARAIVFGTLAQRNAITRGTIERLWETDALKVLDVNLRPPYDDIEIVRRSLHHADVVKMNDAELGRIAGWFDMQGSIQEMTAAVAEVFACQAVCITRGRDGAALWREGRWTEHPGFEVEVRDTVGAGDAFLAVLLAGLLTGVEDRALLQNANLIGAYVATQAGAVPADQPAAPVPVSAPVAERSAPNARRRRRPGAR